MGEIKTSGELTLDYAIELIDTGAKFLKGYRGEVSPRALGKVMRQLYAGWASVMRDDGENPNQGRGPLTESELCTKAAEGIKQTMRMLMISNFLQGENPAVVRAVLRGEHRIYLAQEQVCGYKDIMVRLRLLPSLHKVHDHFKNAEIPPPLEKRLRFLEKRYGMKADIDEILRRIGYYLPPQRTFVPERAAIPDCPVILTPSGFYRPERKAPPKSNRAHACAQ